MGLLNSGKEQIEKNIVTNKTMQIKSNLAFLNSHNGLRYGKIHTFMAGAGSGKSTLMRTIVKDIIENNAIDGVDIGIWLSEETEDDFKTEFFKGKKVEDKYAMVNITSELDIKEKKNLGFHLKDKIGRDKVFIFDNLTTSMIYNDRTPKEQAAFLYKIKDMVKEKNICCIMVLHADGKQNENKQVMPSMNDVRGSKTITNLSEFFYIIQPIFVGNTQHTFLTIKKNRGQDLEGKYYQLPYSKEMACYKNDTLLSFNDVNELFKNSNRIKLT